MVAGWKIAPSYNTNVSARTLSNMSYHRICQAETSCNPECYIMNNPELRTLVDNHFMLKYMAEDQAKSQAALEQGHKYALRHYVTHIQAAQTKGCTCKFGRRMSTSHLPLQIAGNAH